jgi:hypothetical protein
MSATGNPLLLLTALGVTHAAAFLIGSLFVSREAPTPATPAPVSRQSPTARETKRERESPKRVDSDDFAGDWQQLHREPMAREDFEKSRRAFLKEWMKRDLGAVLDVFYGPAAKGTRPRLDGEVSNALYQQIAAQAPEVLQWIQQGRFGSARQEMFSTWFSAIQETPNRSLIISEFNRMTPYERTWSVQSLVDRLDPHEMAALRDQIVTGPKHDLYDPTTRNSYARRMITLAWENPESVFARENDPALLRALGAAWAQKRFGSDPDPAKLDKFTELPEAARPGALNTIFSAADERMVAGVLPVFRELERLQCWKDLAGEEAAHAMLVIAERKGDAAKLTAEWVSQLANAEARQNLTKSVALGYQRTDQVGCLRWMETLPAGPERDATLDALIRNSYGNKDFQKGAFRLVQDPTLSAKLAAEIPDLR